MKTADFVIETFAPGYLDNLGLGYADLEKINPGVIMVSITPFGQTGPYRDWKAPDIVAWAMGGEMAPFGDADRPPVHVSYHSQAYLNAGADGAMGALMALLSPRRKPGRAARRRFHPGSCRPVHGAHHLGLGPAQDSPEAGGGGDRRERDGSD